MYGVALDLAGNYLLLGGSGDEYTTYSVNNTAGDSSDVWVSYLVVLDPQVSINIHKLKNTLQKYLIYSKENSGKCFVHNFYGDQEGNNTGEYLALM